MGSRSDEVDDIRREIDETRESLDTGVRALAYKAEVKNRGKEAIDDKKEVVMDKVGELKEKMPGAGGYDGGPGMGAQVKDKMPDAGAMREKLPDGQAIKDRMPAGTPSKEDVKAKAQDAAQTAKDNPIAVVAGAAAAGLAAGLAVPETEIERETLKPRAQEARRQVEGKVQDNVAQIKAACRMRSTARPTPFAGRLGSSAARSARWPRRPPTRRRRRAARCSGRTREPRGAPAAAGGIYAQPGSTDVDCS